MLNGRKSAAGAVMAGLFLGIAAGSQGQGEGKDGITFNPVSSEVEVPVIETDYKSRKLNPLYFRGLSEKPWWDERWDYRLPVMVFEPVGLQRCRAPVSVIHDFPDDTRSESKRVVTPWGEEVPSQTSVKDTAEKIIEVVFLQDLLANETMPVFIYFGNKAVSPPEYATDLELVEEEHNFILSNRRIRVQLTREPSSKMGPIISHLQPQGNPTGNQLMGDGKWYTRGCANRLYPNQEQSFPDIRVKEDGPVRKVIEYRGTCKGGKVTFTYILYSESGQISYSLHADKPLEVDKLNFYSPGEGLKDVPDRFYYECREGVGSVEIRDMALPLIKNVAPLMKEGWYAFRDAETDQVIGEIFELDDNPRISILIHPIHRYRTSIICKLPTRGAFIPAQGSFNRIRNPYLAWKNPPRIYIAEIQPKQPLETRVPVFGKEMLLGYNIGYGSYMMRANIAPERPAELVPVLTRQIEREGGNYVAVIAALPLWKSKWEKHPECTPVLGELLEQAHGQGVGVALCIIPRTGSYYTPVLEGMKEKRRYLCKIKYRDRYVQATGELGPYDLDMLFLADEAKIYLPSQEARDAFKDKYQMEFPEGYQRSLDLKRMSEPQYHNAFFFKMDTLTDCLREQAEALRKKNRKTIVSHITNPRKLSDLSLGMYHDLEKQLDFLDTVCTDLYGPANQHQKHRTKYFRGLMNNERPIVLYTTCTRIPQVAEENLYYLLLWGMDGCFSFGVPNSLSPRVNEAMRKAFYHVDYTGLGNMLVECKPVKYVAILRDRAAFIDSVKEKVPYERRIRNLTSVKNLPTDIIFSRYFDLKTLRRYKLVVIPNNPVISTGDAEVIEEYVKQGGNVILEGEAINNPLLQSLCGAVPKGKKAEKRGRVTMEDGKLHLSFYGDSVPVENKNGGMIAGLDDGTPAFIQSASGKGKIVYTPLIISDRIDQKGPWADFFKGLVRRMVGGNLPVEIDKENSNIIESNLFTDGDRYVFGVFNPDRERGAEINAEFNIPFPADSIVVNMRSGERRKFRKNTGFKVGPREVAFYYMGPEEFMKQPPVIELSTLETGLYYSLSPGMGSSVGEQPDKSDADRKVTGCEKKEAGISHIGILTDKGREGGRDARVRGDEGIHQALQNRNGLKPEYIRDLRPETLGSYDVVIVPNIGNAKLPPVMHEGWEEDIRKYVQGGGSVMLNHHAAGSPPCRASIFPEIGKAGTYAAIRDMVVTRDHPIINAESIKKRFQREWDRSPAFEMKVTGYILNVGDKFRCGFPDYVGIRPGKEGAALVESARVEGIGGDPVIVAGRAGKGRVVLSGMAVGAKSDTEEGVTESGERNILINSVYWLAEK